MKIDGTLSVARLAADIPGAMAVFESLGVDYACAGGRSVADAAHAEGLDPELVIGALRRLKPVSQAQSWSDRPLADLVQYIAAQHHRFVREELAVIALRLADFCASADAQPDLLSLRAGFTRLTDLLLPHMQREEKHVFGAVEALEDDWQSNERLIAEARLATHVRELTLEHGAIAAQLRTIRQLRLGLAASLDLVARLDALLNSVASLEAHLHEYMFLENAVLFPRALSQEGEALASVS